MNIAAARAFVAAIRTLTPDELAALGVPLAAGTLNAANAWSKMAAARVLQSDPSDNDYTGEERDQEVAEVGELSIAVLISYGIVTGRLAPLEKYEHTAEVIGKFLSDSPDLSNEEAEAALAFMQSQEISQITFDVNLEGSPFCAAWLRLSSILMARIYRLPCPIADAESLLPARMRAA
jgi:hypothetical protein